MPTGIGIEPSSTPKAIITKMGISSTPPFLALLLLAAVALAAVSTVVGSEARSLGLISRQVTIIPTTAKG